MKTETFYKDVMNTNQIFDLNSIFNRNYCSDESIAVIRNENLLPMGLLKRLHYCYPQHSGFFRTDEAYFTDKTYYSGLNGFREIVEKLKEHGIEIGHIKEREFFIEVYRFLATKHTLNSINWNNYESDTMYYLIFS